MRVYQRGSAWGIDYSYNGVRIRKLIGKSRNEAELALLEIKGKIQDGTLEVATRPVEIDEIKKADVRKKTLVFDNLCEEYLEYSKANKRPQSYRRDQVSIKSLLRTFSRKLITNIVAHDLERYKNKRRQQVKPATVNRELSCIKHMFNRAVVWGYLQNHLLHKIKQFKEPAGRIKYLTEEEIPRLLKACTRYLRPIVIMALNTGMRKGEILNLEWTDVDLNNKTLIVRDSKNNQSRVLPINRDLYDELVMKKANANSKYVFAHHDGTQFHEIYYGFKAALKRAGIKNFTFHDLRHTFASRLAMSGYDIRVIQVLMGHKTITMTMRYSHLSPKTLRDAVDSLCLSKDKNQEKTGLNKQDPEKTANNNDRNSDTKNGTNVAQT